MDLFRAHDVAVEAAEAAGVLLRRGLFEQKVVSRKSSAVDLLTQHDQAAEAVIVDKLKASFPSHRLITEEGSPDGKQSNNPGSSYTWYIDPLDGTNNFAHGYPVFCVSIALYENNRPLLGVITDPNRDERFSAIAGNGAYLSTNRKQVRLQVSQTETLLDSLLATGFPYDRHSNHENNVAQMGAFLKKAQGIRRGGAAALDMAYVAAGRLDGYWEFKLSSWDIAAGVCLVLEAGGRVSGMDGQPWIPKTKVSVIASNGRIHPAMMAVLAETGANF